MLYHNESYGRWNEKSSRIKIFKNTLKQEKDRRFSVLFLFCFFVKILTILLNNLLLSKRITK